MEKSDKIGSLAAALCKAQRAMGAAKKDSTLKVTAKGTGAPLFTTKYADLAAVIEAVKEPLSDNALSFVQAVDTNEAGAIVVETILLHDSGEWIGSKLAMKPTGSDPQSIGSCITYARRYSLQSLVGLPADDDDGTAASGRKAEPAEAKKSPPPEQSTLDAVYSNISKVESIPHLENYEKILRGTATGPKAKEHVHFNIIPKLNPGDKKALETRISARRELIKDSLPKGVDTVAMFELAGKKAVTKEEIKAQLKDAYQHDDLTRITADQMDTIMT